MDLTNIRFILPLIARLIERLTNNNINLFNTDLTSATQTLSIESLQ